MRLPAMSSLPTVGLCKHMRLPTVYMYIYSLPVHVTAAAAANCSCTSMITVDCPRYSLNFAKDITILSHLKPSNT